MVTKCDNRTVYRPHSFFESMAIYDQKYSWWGLLVSDKKTKMAARYPSGEGEEMVNDQSSPPTPVAGDPHTAHFNKHGRTYIYPMRRGEI